MRHRLARLSFQVCVTLIAACACGCGRDDPKPQAPVDQDKLLRTQLAGEWERQWELGPVVYYRLLKDDGTVIMREYRSTTSAPAATSRPAGNAQGRYHRAYRVFLPLQRELSGTWSVQDGNVCYNVSLPNGDPLRLLYRIDRISASEFTESTSGLDGRIEARFTRPDDGRKATPSTRTSSVR
ncbi:MAG: hypothetical protein ACE15C_18205 [Phycisphaerae bacterium]